MKIFKRKKKEIDALEQRLDIISDLTRDLERTEFNNLVEALKAMFDARQKLRKVKTPEEKEVEPIDEAEKILEKEVKKAKETK